MPVEVVSYMFSSRDLRKRLQFQIILQCAPFLKGLKVACIINLGSGACKELGSVLEGTRIEYRILSERDNKCLVLFYRGEEFRRYLEREDVCGFLEGCGYRTKDMEAVLSRLAMRVCRYSGKGIGFPHEIGAFLDYPIEDVMCFIREEGRNSLFSGYWKVYHNPGKAQMTFYAYDKAKVSAVNEFLAGKTIRDIAY